MFNNIIYFIVALLIFNISYPEKAPEGSLFFTAAMLFLSWAVFAGYCFWGFRHFKRGVTKGGYAGGNIGALSAFYQRLVVRLSVLALFLFALAVFLFNIKYWILLVPFAEKFSVFQGLAALSLFFFYLCTIWYFAYPAYEAIFRPGIRKKSFIVSNLRLNFPVLFPWASLSLVYDLVALTALFGPDRFFNSVQGQILFFAVFLMLLMIFMPALIQRWWGCRPIRDGLKGRELEKFLKDNGFRYRGLLDWPIFEGRMMTAGIMGIVPRYRYILVADSLLEILSMEELKAVLAHEMGHARYRHLAFYLLFFIGFMIISMGMPDMVVSLLLLFPFFQDILVSEGTQSASLFYLIFSIPMLISLLIYFRYVMGFFMRNYERQADLYSASLMGTPEPIISSLEKIAYAGGRSRNVPSWHHFSVRQRVEYLWKTISDPGMFRRHNRFVFKAFIIYLVCMGAVGYFLHLSGAKDRFNRFAVTRAIERQVVEDPDNAALLQTVGSLYLEMGGYPEAAGAYERVIAIEPENAAALNNLAWILATAPQKDLLNPPRAVALAQRAVSIERSAMFLDTLAEAHFVNGSAQKAITIIEEAIDRAEENRTYYKGQLRKFRGLED